MTDEEFQEEQDRMLREAGQFYLALTRIERRRTLAGLPLVDFWLKSLYILMTFIGMWVFAKEGPAPFRPVIVGLITGWSLWVIWVARPRPCVICGRRTKRFEANFSYRPRRFLDVRPLSQRMCVFVCRQHQDQISLRHLMQRSVVRPPGGDLSDSGETDNGTR